VLAIVTERPDAEFMEQCLIVDQTNGSVLDPSQDQASYARSLISIPQRTVAVVERTGDIAVAAKEIASCTMLFNGQSRYSVDQVLVNEYVFEKFLTALERELLSGAERKQRVGRMGNQQKAAGSTVLLELQGVKAIAVDDR
jgi:hypothetical protein